jgi:hypothetical protein
LYGTVNGSLGQIIEITSAKDRSILAAIQSELSNPTGASHQSSAAITSSGQIDLDYNRWRQYDSGSDRIAATPHTIIDCTLVERVLDMPMEQVERLADCVEQRTGLSILASQLLQLIEGLAQSH